ncbi:MAG: hypothetical protein CL916_10750, partial [Deltaproteobacteria bacterium]|nr:hypothetical protein [Deltaproteobacteria bacterium]
MLFLYLCSCSSKESSYADEEKSLNESTVIDSQVLSDEDVDLDGDGYSLVDGDCNDQDETVFPQAVEVCDEQDNNCNGLIDEGQETYWFLDWDGDGFGNDEEMIFACEPPLGYVMIGGDCADNNQFVHPGVEEICDGKDNNCDDVIDEEVILIMYRDRDQDGFGDPLEEIQVCEPLSGYTYNDQDCNDLSPLAYPQGLEYCDGIDNDCNDLVDDEPVNPPVWYSDDDGDGFAGTILDVISCDPPVGAFFSREDCDDSESSINPAAIEVCDDIDNDCNLLVDDGAIDKVLWHNDIDQDGYGDPNATVFVCDMPPGYVQNDLDCNDNDAMMSPVGVEICDGKDNDCDAQIDNNPIHPPVWYSDEDGDGFAGTVMNVLSCTLPAGGYVSSDDCDDSESSVNPAAVEVCDEVDNDCNVLVDDGAVDALPWYGDFDGDGYGDMQYLTMACTIPSFHVSNLLDCDDADPFIKPGGVEVCDEQDNNCNGSTDEGVQTVFFADLDEDGVGNTLDPIPACSLPENAAIINGDCDDEDSGRSPLIAEVCDSIDNDCDNQIDEGVRNQYFTDNDGDGFGNPSLPVLACTQPMQSSINNLDCNDGSASINPAADEICDGIDNDCSQQVDDNAVDAITWYLDLDNDGYGRVNSTLISCIQPQGYVDNSQDCDDGDVLNNPQGIEICDTEDNDCDGLIDDADGDLDLSTQRTFGLDLDNDGFGSSDSVVSACVAPSSSYRANTLDCDDTDA